MFSCSTSFSSHFPYLKTAPIFQNNRACVTTHHTNSIAAKKSLTWSASFQSSCPCEDCWFHREFATCVGTKSYFPRCFFVLRCVCVCVFVRCVCHTCRVLFVLKWIHFLLRTRIWDGTMYRAKGCKQGWTMRTGISYGRQSSERLDFKRIRSIALATNTISIKHQVETGRITLDVQRELHPKWVCSPFKKNMKS